jgi:hypothetical protein
MEPEDISSMAVTPRAYLRLPSGRCPLWVVGCVPVPSLESGADFRFMGL